jgi:hypothetical protein
MTSGETNVGQKNLTKTRDKIVRFSGRGIFGEGKVAGDICVLKINTLCQKENAQ